jgi:hypothetical protein
MNMIGFDFHRLGTRATVVAGPGETESL